MDQHSNDGLAGLLKKLESFELPVLLKESFKCGAALLVDLPASVTPPQNIYRLLDHYVTQIFPARFDWSPVFQWAGGPGDGRRVREELDEENFESDEQLDAAMNNYYEHFGEPDPWTEITASSSQRELVLTFLRERVQWTINNKRYRIPRLFGRVEYKSHSMNRREQKIIAEQEAEHQRRRTKLMEMFVDCISEPFRFLHTNHVLAHDSAKQEGWELHRDEIFALVDPQHLRVLWMIHDRYYG